MQQPEHQPDSVSVRAQQPHAEDESESCVTSVTEVQRPAQQRRRRYLLPAALLIFTASLAGAVVRDSNPEELDLWTVEPAVFRDAIETQGTVSPLHTARVVSECRWSTRIVSIVPEGTWVQKGDVVCVLDSSEIEEYLRSREIRLITARANLESSVQDELIESTRSERRLARAQFDLNDAELALSEYTEGTWPEQLAELDRNIGIAGDRLATAQDDHAFMEQLWMRGQVSERTMAQASFDLLNRSTAARELENRRQMLSNFGHPRLETQLQYRRDDAQRDLLRTEIATSLAETNAKLNTLSDERRVTIYERYLQFAKDSLEACTLRAPRDGQVIYATSWYLKSRGINSIEAGQTVSWQQGIFEIPDSTRFKVSVPLNEALITRVYRGMPATVQLKGYEDDPIDGEIQHISRYPRTRSSYTPGIREYWMDIVLSPTDKQRLNVRTNADATATLVLKEDPDALMIPRDAVVGVAGSNFVYRMNGTDLVVQPVTLGDIQNDQVVVREGLHLGDRVAVSPPEQQTEALATQLGG